jgi:DNA gyrase subunit A
MATDTADNTDTAETTVADGTDEDTSDVDELVRRAEADTDDDAINGDDTDDSDE